MRQQEVWKEERERGISKMSGLLKFITCGSVDDGKSTLIGHILYDAKLLYTDQEKALELDSKVGSRGGAIDYSLLLDGLMAEREQGPVCRAGAAHRLRAPAPGRPDRDGQGVPRVGVRAREPWVR